MRRHAIPGLRVAQRLCSRPSRSARRPPRGHRRRGPPTRPLGDRRRGLRRLRLRAPLHRTPPRHGRPHGKRVLPIEEPRIGPIGKATRHLRWHGSPPTTRTPRLRSSRAGDVRWGALPTPAGELADPIQRPTLLRAVPDARTAAFIVPLVTVNGSRRLHDEPGYGPSRERLIRGTTGRDVEVIEDAHDANALGDRRGHPHPPAAPTDTRARRPSTHATTGAPTRCARSPSSLRPVRRRRPSAFHAVVIHLAALARRPMHAPALDHPLDDCTQVVSRRRRGRPVASRR